jgi:hypothetical protein
VTITNTGKILTAIGSTIMIVALMLVIVPVTEVKGIAPTCGPNAADCAVPFSPGHNDPAQLASPGQAQKSGAGPADTFAPGIVKCCH